MNLKRVMDIYEIIKKRLPRSYPKPKLIFFEDEECMLNNHKEIIKQQGESVYAIMDPETCTISLPLKMAMAYRISSGSVENEILLTKLSDREIAINLLHEIGHFYAGERYGFNSKQYSDERYCDNFAYRWVRILYKEKLLKE